MSNTTNNSKEQFDPYKPHPVKWWGWLLLLFLIAGTVYVCYRERHGNSDQPLAVTNGTAAKPWTESNSQFCEGSVFGTFYHITYQSDNNLQNGIEQTLDAVNNSLSPFNKQSVITAINEGTSMKVDTMFTKVFNLAKTVSAETNGAFDITVAPLVNLWGFGFKTGSGVPEDKVDSLLQYVGFSTVNIVNGEVVKEHTETMLDCSAVAKGFGVDAVGEYLESQGVTSYMVEIGGEVRLRGCNLKGTDWNIGVATPSDSVEQQNEMQQVISTTNRSLATSGNYRNFYVKDGKKYAHTIDPRTGYPVQHSILSSTVLANDCATADAYATAFMVLGLDDAKRVLAKHTELDAYFIFTDTNGEMAEWSTENMAKLLKR